MSLGLNALAIGTLLQTRPPITPAAAPQAMDVVILPPPAQAQSLPPAAAPPQPQLRRRPVDAAPIAAIPRIHPPSPQASAPATPPAAAAAAPAIDARVAGTLRRKTGCQQAKLLGLTEAEQQACEEAFAAGAKTAPLYPVISDKQKQIFDGTYCPPDDEWCLYRMGRGPYPGLVSLFRQLHQ